MDIRKGKARIICLRMKTHCRWSDEHAGEGIPYRGCSEMIIFVVAEGSYASETLIMFWGEHCEQLRKAMLQDTANT